MGKRKFIFLILILSLLSSSALATGINVYFQPNAIMDRTGAVLDAGSYHPYGRGGIEGNNFQFYHNSLPAPNDNDTPLGVPREYGGEYTVIGGDHKYQYSSLDGGTFWVRVWSGTETGPMTNQGKYYGTASHSVASGTTLPDDWRIHTLRTSYHAHVPPPPNVSAGIPAYARQEGRGGRPVLVPYVTINMSNSNITNYEVTSYHLRIWRADDPTRRVIIEEDVDNDPDNSVNYTTNPATEPLEFGTRYAVAATARNWFGPSDYGPSDDFETIVLEEGGAPFTPVHHLAIRFVSPDILGLSWQGSDRVDIYQSNNVDSDYSREWGGVAGTSKNDIGRPDNTTYYRIVPAESVVAGATGGTVPSETVALLRYNLRRAAGGFGINTISFSFVPDMVGTRGGIANIGQLVAEINAQGGGERTTLVGWWDAENQGYVGYYYDEVAGRWRDIHTNVDVDLLNVNLEMNQPYQISVNQAVTLRLAGKI